MVVDKYSDTYPDTRKGYPYIHGFSNNDLDIGKPARADNGNEHIMWGVSEPPPRADKSAVGAINRPLRMVGSFDSRGRSVLNYLWERW